MHLPSLLLGALLALQAARPGGAQTPPPPPAPLTLDEAMTAALAASPALRAAGLGRAEAAARGDLARQRPNPEIALEESPQDFPRDAATLSVPIERGGKRRRRIEVATAQARSGEAEIARLRVDVRNQVRRAYFALSAAQQRLEETAELLQLAHRAGDTAHARFETGDVPRLDVLQAELAVLQAVNETDRARGLLAGVRADLNALLGRPLDAPLAVNTALNAGRVPPPDEAARLALSSSTELAVLELGIAQQKAQVELARAEAVPDVTAAAGVLHHAPPDFDWGWRGGITIPLPIFTRNRAQTRLEEATLARLQAESAAAAARLRGEVYSAAANAEAQRLAYLRYRDGILPRATEVESLAEDSYRSGQTNLVTLLQTLQSVHDLHLQAVQAGTEYQNALADLERAMGAPLP
ncbi:MAG TPA: TolC family protein [Thermoanaerobaculia bacterium]|nr:TolC family protein [Thermoanaerobaculia bacterium]